MIPACLWPAAASAQDGVKQAVASCRLIADAGGRLACYDGIAIEAPPRWAGRLSYSTEPFEIDRPTVIRFESLGVIFVMALKDARGEVIENLHHAGTGEGRYRIAKPGTYSLQISGAEGWRIWLEPEKEH
jgi:hypothetical protein